MAKGIKVAPSFASLFMVYFEERWVYTYQVQPSMWLRYIDDIFIVWKKGENSLSNFITHLNSCHTTISRTNVSCKSNNLIYCISCNICHNTMDRPRTE